MADRGPACAVGANGPIRSRHLRHPRHPCHPHPPRVDDGSAVVDFVLVGALTTMVFAAVLQLVLVLHVRATLIDCAAEGARYGALAGSSPEAGAARTRELITSALAAGFADNVHGEAAVVDDLPVVRVEVTAPLPLVGLLGPSGAITVDGHALREAP